MNLKKDLEAKIQFFPHELYSYKVVSTNYWILTYGFSKYAN